MHLRKSPIIIYLFLNVLFLVSCKTEMITYGPDIYVEDPGFKVVGYLGAGNFGKIDSIELDLITHLCLAFANPDENGNLTFSQDKDVRQIVEKGHQAGVKVLVSLAGGGTPNKHDWKKALNPSNKTNFIMNILKYVEENNLDGVDVDIEWNLLPALDELYAPFVLELQRGLHAKGKTISTALNVSGLHPAVTQECLKAYDFINIMVYDKTGPWKPDNPGQHAPYSYAEEAYDYWTKERKISADRLVLGMPFYGHNFDPVGSMQYAKIVENDVANAYKDQVGQLYYNGIPTIVKKTILAREKFNGVMFWELSQDTHNDLSLLRASHQTLQAGNCQVLIFFKDEDGDGFGNRAKPFQACKAPEGYVPNADDSDDANANLHP